MIQNTNLTTLAEHIREAWHARDELHASSIDAYRLFHGYQEGCPGLEIDRYGDIAIIASKGASDDDVTEAASVLATLYPFSCIVGKTREAPPKAIVGTMPTDATIACESQLQFEIEAFAPRNPGLYLDARPARQWLVDNAKGIRVLNLFSYAGSLGVAAMAGGALSVTHVDTQKRALRRCQSNHERNNQPIDPRDLMCLDVPKYLKKLVAGKRRFGGVIVDPPPFKPGSKSDARNLSAVGLSRLAFRGLQEGGWMLCFFHHDPRSWDELEAAVSEACQRKFEVLWRSLSGSDFPEPDERRALRLSVFR